MRRERCGRDEGSGSVLAVGIVAGVVVVALVAIPLTTVVAQRAAVAAAADAAALAAADTAVGLHPGFPCEVASAVASANGAAVSDCEVDGLIATVGVERSILGLAVSARATAGPPPGESD